VEGVGSLFWRFYFYQEKRKMKRVMAFALTLLLSALAAHAQQNTATSTTTTTRRRAAATRTDPAIADQLNQLKQSMDAQQEQIRQLSQQIQRRDQQVQELQQKLDQIQAATSQAASKADAAASQSSEQQQTVTTLKSDVSDLKNNTTNAALTMQETQKENHKTLDELKGLQKLKFSGDLRLRFEPFFGGGAVSAAAPEDRFRERYRLRFNVNTKVSDDFSAAFSLASGDLGDPVSTNSTQTGFYTRKPVAIDKAFGVYNPHNFKPFTLTVGKFGYTWLRTEMTWDNDLNPEGASAAVAWDWKNSFVNHFGVVALGTTILESGGGADTYMEGGQVQTGWSILPKVKLTADAAYYDFHNVDSIAQNQGQIPANGSATQGIPNTGGGSFGFSASSLTNNFGTIGTKRFFGSKYGIFDAIARLDVETGTKRWPIYALIDYADNTEACSNIVVFFAAAAAVPTCDPHQRHAYWGELKFGQTKNKGDLLLGYTFARIERDSVLSAFNFSDLRQPTNVLEHRLEAYYQAQAHVQLGVTGLIGREIVTAQSPTEERWLKRWQFDSIFTF
jgi:TolA-binding protein